MRRVKQYRVRAVRGGRDIGDPTWIDAGNARDAVDVARRAIPGPVAADMTFLVQEYQTCRRCDGAGILRVGDEWTPV